MIKPVKRKSRTNSGKIQLQNLLYSRITDHHSSLEFRIVLRKNHLTQKLIRPNTPEHNGIVEKAKKHYGSHWFLWYCRIVNMPNMRYSESRSITTITGDIYHRTVSHRSSITGEIQDRKGKNIKERK